MPQTALCFLIGAMAVSGIPPLNGFVSEWLTLQAFFLGALNVTPGAKLFFGICASLLVLTSGLSAACFVKAFGITFLAKPRSRFVEPAKESGLSMKIGMFILALLTVALGLACVFIIKLLAIVAGGALGIDVSAMRFYLNNFTISPQIAKSIYLSTPLLMFVFILLALLSFVASKLFSRQKTLIYKTWDCGYYKLDSRNEYTATAFSKPFRIAFSFFLLPYRKTQKIRESFYHVKSFTYETRTTLVFKKYIYLPILAAVIKSAKFMRRIQPGSIHLYLAYIFVTLLLMIVFMGKF
jgi:hydrogenase-4 component B